MAAPASKRPMPPWAAILVTVAVTVAVLVPLNLCMQPKPITCVTPDDCRDVARYNTVVSGSRSAITLGVVVIVFFVILGLAGVDAKGLLLSAGVVGLVFGLGAQSLIRSFIAGLVLLSSNRFNLGDLVRLNVLGVPSPTLLDAAPGSVTGMPEGIVRAFSLTTTTLEDTRGAKMYVSNGNIALVTNYSQNPQRSTVDIHVSRATDPTVLRTGLEQFVEGMALDAALRGKVLRPPAVKGVTAIGEHSYIVTITALSTPGDTLAIERHIRERVLHYLASVGVTGSAALEFSSKADTT